MSIPRTIIGGMGLACVVAVVLSFYFAGVHKMRAGSAGKNAAVPARSLPAERMAPR